VSGAAQVFDRAQVSGAAQVFDRARVFGDAQVFGAAQVFDRARVFGAAQVSGAAWDVSPFFAIVGRFGLTHTDRNRVQIGCQNHSISEWLGKVGRDLKKQHNLTSGEAQTIHTLLLMLKNAKQPKAVKSEKVTK
jgi:hypothetical protein